jgi:hypothetical protein
MRRRLASVLLNLPGDRDELGSLVTRELGISVPYGPYSYRWEEFLDNCEVHDVLDFVTIAFRQLSRQGRFAGRAEH